MNNVIILSLLFLGAAIPLMAATEDTTLTGGQTKRVKIDTVSVPKQSAESDSAFNEDFSAIHDEPSPKDTLATTTPPKVFAPPEPHHVKRSHKKCGKNHKKYHDRCGEGNRRGGFFAPQVLFFDSDLPSQIHDHEKELDTLEFDFSNTATFMIGGMGYSETPDGFRTGSGFWIGHKQYQSATFLESDTTDSGAVTTREMVTSLRIIPVYTGMLLEKNFDFHYWSMYVGGLVGGGVYIIHRNRVEEGDLFISDEEFDSDDEDLWDSDRNAFALAPYLAGDLHAGMAVRVSPMIQIGAEFVLSVSYSSGGFITGAGFGDFYTTSPGIRLRLMIGKM